MNDLDERRRPSGRLLVGRVALFFAATVLLIVVAEAVCRFLPAARTAVERAELPWFTSSFYRVVDDARGYEIRPRATSQTNNLGMRGRYCSAKKRPGTFRVWVLGDSLAYGTGVNQFETFSAVLEKRLRRQYGLRAEVLNAGVPGYNTRQELAALELGMQTYEPDLVVLTWCPNDMQVTPVVFKEGDDFRAYRVGASELRFGGWWFERSALYRRLAALRVAIGTNEDGDFERNIAALTEIAAVLRNANVPLVVILFPYLAPGPPRYPPLLAALRDRAKETLDAAGVPVIDLLEAWADRSFDELRLATDRSDVIHPNATGHADVAARIDAWIVERGLIAGSR